MRDRMAALSDHDPILKWLAFEHFVFLGEQYVVEPSNREEHYQLLLHCEKNDEVPTLQMEALIPTLMTASHFREPHRHT